MSARVAVPRYRPFAGPDLFQAGFRVFFLAAAAWAAFGMLVWLPAFAGHIAVGGPLDPATWHMHEMLFGFGVATLTGFLLTAIPNWTGRLPLQGLPLILLFLLWLLGRLAVSGLAQLAPAVVALIDISFLAVLVGVVAREIVAGRNWRNLPVVAALSLLLAANALIHAEAIGLADTAVTGVRLGISTLVTLIALVGGRIVPSFTRNWLVKQVPGSPLPAAFGTIDRAALIVIGAALAAWTAALPAIATAPLLGVAGVLATLRLTRWQGHLTWREPLLSILHVGMAWLAAGLLLLGLSEAGTIVSPSSGVHALTVGAIGTMTLAVMSRATLGHTGRDLTAGTGTAAIFVCVNLAAVCRIAAGLIDAFYLELLIAAGLSWIAAFAMFLVNYGPMLLQPRANA